MTHCEALTPEEIWWQAWRKSPPINETEAKVFKAAVDKFVAECKARGIRDAGPQP